MLRLMLPALAPAGIADFCAKGADSRREFTPARHESCRERANVRAIAIELDAAGHHFDVLLVQALGRAMFARRRAGVAGVDTLWYFSCAMFFFFLG